MAGINFISTSLRSLPCLYLRRMKSPANSIEHFACMAIIAKTYIPHGFSNRFERLFSSKNTNEINESPRIQEFRKKLRERAPIEKLEELEEGKHPYQEKEPLEPFPNNTNPETGEIGGPRGPEPTRYGDWERKGRVTDF